MFKSTNLPGEADKYMDHDLYLKMLTLPPKWARKKRLLTRACEDSDPINLIFESVSVTDINNVFTKPWNPPSFAHDLYIDDACTQKQDSQWVDGPLWRRYHVRIWQHGSDVIGSAHYETVRFRRHEVHHFEGGEDEVAEFFEKNGWQTTQKLQLDNYIRERYNDGKATIIKR